MRQKKTRHRLNEVMEVLFYKKCYELWTYPQLKLHLKDDLGYSDSSAQRYIELLKQKMRTEFEYNYQDALANMVEYLSNEIKRIDDPSVRIQYIKELNRIQSLGNQQKVDITSGGEPIQYNISLIQYTASEDKENQS